MPERLIPAGRFAPLFILPLAVWMGPSGGLSAQEVTPENMAALQARSIGPAGMSGRIAAMKTGVEKKVTRLGSDPTPASLVEVAVYALENGLKSTGHKLLEMPVGSVLASVARERVALYQGRCRKGFG